MSKRREAAFVEPARDGEVEAGERVGALELMAGVMSDYRAWVREVPSPRPAAPLGAARPAVGDLVDVAHAGRSALPVTARKGDRMTTTAPPTAQLLHRGAGTGPSYWGPGDRYTFLVTGKETGGAYFAMEAFVPPGGGSGPHVHTREDETFYVLEG